MKIKLYVQLETPTHHFSITRKPREDFQHGDSIYVLRRPLEETNYVSHKVNKRRICKFVSDVSK